MGLPSSSRSNSGSKDTRIGFQLDSIQDVTLVQRGRSETLQKYSPQSITTSIEETRVSLFQVTSITSDFNLLKSTCTFNKKSLNGQGNSMVMVLQKKFFV